MVKINLQLFGGRGASAPAAIPNGGSGSGNGNWSNGLGTNVEQDPVKALGVQGRPKGIEDATLKTNPNHSYQYSEYSENCQRCVVAYEARRRGYDVTAQPTYQGDQAPSNWRDQFFKGAKQDPVGASSANTTVKNLEKQMAQYGEGSRAVVHVDWKAGGGHVFMVEQKNGKTIYRDPQVGVKYDSKTVFTNVKTKGVTLTRVDNLDFTDSIGAAVTKEKY